MSALPWDKFFWADWESDQELGLCSIAAQGLWMRMLCLAARASRRGYVMIADRPATTEDLSKLARTPLSETETLIKELESNGVFSRDRSGTIYSRRMVREAKRRRASAKGGRKGGRASVYNKSGIHSTPASTPNGTPHPMVNTRSQKPEARSQIRKRDKPSLLPKRKSFEFPNWWPTEEWSAYVEMRRKAKKPLTDLATKRAVERVGKFREAGYSPGAVIEQSVCKGWTDFYTPKNGNSAHSAVPDGALPLTWDDQRRRDVERFVQSGMWLSTNGPPPLDEEGHFNAECCYPAKMLAEFGIKPGCEIKIGRPN